jgi:molybdenum cofactor cytidylyltransferase
MPVDPGNLLLLGHKAHVPIVGVPGCARSLKPSGFDWILERLAADLPIAREDIMRLGAGGLLADVSGRPSPRQAPKTKLPAPPRVAAVVLAAGSSRRMGGANKLLTEIDGVPMVVRVVDALLASKAEGVLVVLGFEAQRVRAALEGRPVRFVENKAHTEGLGTSLRVGIDALDQGIDAALVALGDMPWIRPEHVDKLIDAFDPDGDSTICVPVHDRKRGHPVLWSARHFGEMRKLGGDVGARGLLERHADAVLAVPIEDAAVLLDVDTPEMIGGATTLGRGARP